MLKIDSNALPPRKNLSREIYENLENAIILGKLPPGTRLGEDVVAGAFGVSRSPVREAITELQRIGFAERTSNRDRRVTVPTEDFIVDCFDVWTLLESERLYEASLRAGEASIARVDELLAGLEAGQREADGPPPAVVGEFHAALRADCKNRQLQRVADDWFKYILWLRNLCLDPVMRHRDDALEDHRLIVKMFKERHRDGLMQVMRQHIFRQRDQVLAKWREASVAGLPDNSEVEEFRMAVNG